MYAENMQRPDTKGLFLTLLLLASPGWLCALESDRQQPLLVDADTTDGTLGDGVAILRGNVEIRQGSLLVQADVAEVEKADGKVRLVALTGSPVVLQQEIENEGLVKATAQAIDYEVANGIVTLTGAADVNHPQYHISGDVLVYDMNQQHFQGSGGGDQGRIRIELAPEVAPNINTTPKKKTADEDGKDTSVSSSSDSGAARAES
jgi:lipopolysaccharide export system protein LptA